MMSSTSKTKDFKFKQFSISGGQSGMPVSTDGVLLGAWANILASESILDIGTGTGLLALMCAQRNQHASITAIDLDHYAFKSAEINTRQSIWHQRVAVIEGDVLRHKFDRAYDHIICNPPYFTSGLQSQIQQRATARHADTLEHKALLERCKMLLNHQGKASFILPIVEGQQFIETAQSDGWHVSRVCQVKPSIKKPVHRLLFELSLEMVEINNTELIIQGMTGYSSDFIALTQDFYLKM